MFTRSNKEWSATCVSSSSLHDFQLVAGSELPTFAASLPIHRCIYCSCVNRYHDHNLVCRSRSCAVWRFNTDTSHSPRYARDRRRIVMNRSRWSIHRGPRAVIVWLTEVTSDGVIHRCHERGIERNRRWCICGEPHYSYIVQMSCKCRSMLSWT